MSVEIPRRTRKSVVQTGKLIRDISFACHGNHFAVEIDGGYHDAQYEKDQRREQYLIEKGWDVIRFVNEDVLNDA
ncbi:endonuclease domain-containing protein [Novipirellula sp. SH528]|uniref:endonuclease domain-containing protein n=1 Tax=Novipirellula sp. SH528 TaxID=3454466 RepID=UPI003FA0E7E4